MNDLRVCFEEVTEFSGIDALKVLFYKQFKIRCSNLPNSKIEVCVYDLNDKFLRSFIVLSEPSEFAIRSLIDELKNMATTQP